jgi:hypothetical protein
VALVRTGVSVEFSVSFSRVIRIGELRTLAVTSNRGGHTNALALQIKTIRATGGINEELLEREVAAPV